MNPIITKIKNNIITIEGEFDYAQNQVFLFGTSNKGIVLAATEKEAQILVYKNDFQDIKIGDQVIVDKGPQEIIVYEDYFGSIISPNEKILFSIHKNPSKTKVIGSSYLRNNSPEILDRVKLSEPLKTGITVIDSIIPIGKGQRELIIGDRTTGKSSIALNAIINQRDTNVKCVYVVIGQKRNTMTAIRDILLDHDALKNCILVFSSPDNSAEQYLAPSFGMALAEGICKNGEDVLIIFDDLSKHANVAREIALFINKNPGREAYPTDIFYEHSFLLERAGRFNEVRNFGSITAIPIVETVQNDIASLIPSNIISITDGQIFTSTDMFNNNEIPAINVNLSISRTGSSVQNPLIKKVSKGLKAQYSMLSEIKKFASMSIDVTPELTKNINRWKGIKNLFQQGGYEGYSEEIMVIVTILFNNDYLTDLTNMSQFMKILKRYIQMDVVANRLFKEISEENFLEEHVVTIFGPLIKSFLGEFGQGISKRELQLYKGSDHVER